MMLLDIDAAAEAVGHGNLIAYPTEAVYGFGCDPRNEDALQALIELKSRDAAKGLILIAVNWQQLEAFIDLDAINSLDPTLLEKAHASWPGPVTWIVPASNNTSPLITGERDTVAVRVSDHPVVCKLCERCNSALTSTSANTSGADVLSSAEQIMEEFQDRIAGVVEGELGGLDKPSSIYDLASGAQLR